ncbi:uncharacterized protein LOC123475239 isoform X1 [Daphnia magna]|uniref:uncharacterized protein LOC123475239 isoform X1 n=1 Tax=Daphnia magna TaxID=35525 RepID=UPI001E1BD860|nr:uncharacterized protein LOC123475239 isoform X1 [Daphnia magna]
MMTLSSRSGELYNECQHYNIGEGEYLRSVGWICGLHLGLASIGIVTVGLTIPWQGKLVFSFKYAEICKKILGKMNNNCADATFGIVILEMKLCQIY